jgi:hypothetical protein
MPEAWSREECEAIVADYFSMLEKELRGEPYSKADHRRQLSLVLGSRSPGSIEYKHQNITAILLRASHTYVTGYKPAWNYQAMLEQVVLDRLARQAKVIDECEERLASSVGVLPALGSWEDLFVDPPERLPERQVHDRPARVPRIIDYAERESRNRALGETGEAFVVELEKRRLGSLGRSDLVGDIEWTSKTRGDGAGYDIRSFRGATDEELFIEVKTTNSGKYQPFLISQNEVAFSEERASQYALYRLFAFSREPKLFRLDGSVGKHVLLEPRTYRALYRL